MAKYSFPDTCQWVLFEPGRSHPQPLGRDGLGCGAVFYNHTHHPHSRLWPQIPDCCFHKLAYIFTGAVHTESHVVCLPNSVVPSM